MFQIAYQHRLGSEASTFAFWIGANLTEWEQQFLHEEVRRIERSVEPSTRTERCLPA